ncbi:MAG: phosphate ABC transporter substrate-binding protein PstS [Actinobacteria bacterium]|nr:phosphate ABC transporter substrate-binding protein PstS [Actinomycetota bacterium]
MRLRNRLGTGLVAAIVGVALVATACGKSSKSSSSNGTTGTTTAQVACATGTITGAGSTFVQTIAQQWIKDFQAKCSGATINYQGVGSGAGITQFNAGTVDFGASDAVMKPEEEAAAKAKGGDVLHIPWSAGGIAIEFHLSGVTDLKLSPDTLAGIFAGTVKTWNASEIKADNSGASLPSTPIQVVHRSDGSGTTNAFTSYMTAVSPTIWKAGAGKDVPWPTGQGAKGSDGVTAAVKQTDGAIGYAEVSYAKGSGLGIASIKNTSGSFVQPDADNVAAALAEATVPADLKIVPNFKPTDAKAYPISIPTWAIVFQKPADAAKGKLLKAFLEYAVGPGQSAAKGLYYAPLPTDLQTKVKAAVESIQA